MRRSIILLALLLAVQLGLALALGLHGQSLEAFKGATPLLEVKAAAIDHLVLDGADGAKLTLEKKDGHWNLPNDFGAPASQQKIDDLLDRLNKITRPWPVGTGKDLEQRFKVADDKYERRLQFLQGDKMVATLLLGSSPGFRKVHARLGGEETVYDIPLSTYEISLKSQDWVDQQMLQLDTKEIEHLKLPDCSLALVTGKLTVEGLAADEQTAEAGVKKLLDTLGGLRILEPVAVPADLPQPPALQLSLWLKNGSQRDYSIYAAKDGKVSDLLQVSGYNYLFKVGPQLRKELSGITRAQLVEAKPAAAAPAPTATAPPKTK